MNVSGEAFETTAGRMGYNRFLLFIAGLGGLLYGIDVGIIAGAFPYLEATFRDHATGQALTSGQLSFIVAAVLLGSVCSTLFAGMLADRFGRRPMMSASGVLFVAGVPVIALAHSYDWLVFGRLLQGVSAGLVGVVVPLYLAECLGASNRGKGAGVFQWLLTLGIAVAALIAFYFSGRVDEIAKLGDADKLFQFKDAAWRNIFWASLPPGILFIAGSFMVAESPRWLFRRGRIDAARAALLRARSEEQAELELKEMADIEAEAKTRAAAADKAGDSLLRRKYVLPFALACLILACNQTTGINSIIGYNANILIQAGLDDKEAHLGYLIFTFVNFLVTIGGVLLVDRKGRKFLLSIGSAGIIVSLACVGLLFQDAEKRQTDCRGVVQAMIAPDQTLKFAFDGETASRLLAGAATGGRPMTLTVIYSYGDFHAATAIARSDDKPPKLIEIARGDCLPSGSVEAFFKNPFADFQGAKSAPLKIDHAVFTPVPGEANGWMTAIGLFTFMAFFAVGPGVCVWLALSELMPTRIRSNGMSIALLINQAVSTAIAAVFLPTVGRHGYSAMFFSFAGCTVIYFITAAFILPETRGKTLEEIEEHFEGAERGRRV